MKFNKEELRLLAKGLNHLKDYYRNAHEHMKTLGVSPDFESIELGEVEVLAEKLKLDGDYFNYGRI
jgi:hypothetical protein